MAAQDDVEKGQGVAIASDDYDDLPPKVANKRRIFFEDDEIQAAGRPLTRTMSNHSLRSVHSARTANQIDPAVLLPIQYRTLSYNIEDGRRATIDKGRPSKKKAAASDDFADADWHIVSDVDICKRLDTDCSFGLSPEQVQAARSKYGNNVYTPPPSRLLQKLFWY